MAENQKTLIELWPLLGEDMKKFVADRPGWLIDALKRAQAKKGNKGWKDVETVINILQFLKDTEYEY
jgi:hypothetical protein